MSAFLLAAGWEELFKLVPFIIALLYWAITHYAGKVPGPPPQRRGQAQPPQPQVGKPAAADPLQAEIDQFLREAQALRERRPSPQAKRPASEDRGRPGQPQRSRAARRTPDVPAKREMQRDDRPPALRPSLSAPTAEAVPSPSPRESVEAHVAQRLDSSKFAQRATQLSHMQASSDAEFQDHMQRVFQRDVGSLKSGPMGVFEAAGATAVAATSAAAAAAAVSAGGSQTATAPNAIRKASSDIALFLAGRKNIRDAIILSEILRRPEDRW